jgi:hypothetical protein
VANFNKGLDENGVLYMWSKVKTFVSDAIGKISIPSKTSDLTNDSGYITKSDVPVCAAASTVTPKMDGTAALGTDSGFARGDHVHPSDTSKVDKEDGMGLSTNDYTTAEKEKLKGIDEGANKYSLPDATTTTKGGVMLSISTSDTSTTKAATPSAVKAAYDLANGKQSPATSLAGYGIQDAYTKTEVDGLVSSALHYKGTKDTYADLPTSGNALGDVWNVATADSNHGVNTGDNVAWNGTDWDVLAGTVDLSGYMLKTDITAITNAELDTICV